MSIEEAAKILLEYGDGCYERPGTSYGSESGGVLECTCCHGLLNAGHIRGHKPDCKLEQARNIVKGIK